MTNESQVPPSRQEQKRQQREAKAIAKANRSWFARHKILTAIGAIILLGILIGIINSLGGNDSTQPTSPAAATPGTGTSADPAGGSTEPNSPAPAPAAASISNGDHVVGTDIDAGVYRAEVNSGFVSLCTVSQTKDGDVMDVRNANEGSVIFTVKDAPGTVVSFSGCENIALAAESVRSNPSPITNGDWLVGEELAPGTYRGLVDTDSAIKLGTISQISKDGDVMDVRNANEGSVVFTVKESAGSIVSFSGFKEIQKTD